MASHAPVVASPPSASLARFARTCRCLSVTLLALALVFLMSEGQPTAYTLQTEPVAVAAFLFMLLGLAAAWTHPLGGGVLTLLAGLAFVASTRAQFAGVALVFIVAALLDVILGLRARRTPSRA